jgi:pimeloyl-ACP methyl ester carboxylesterase
MAMCVRVGRLEVFAAACFISFGVLAQSSQTPAPDADDETPVAVGAPIRERLLWVPVTIGHDRMVQLHARLCLPTSAEPATLVLINHGSPPVPSERSKIKLGRCDQEAAQWFLKRGYAVAFVLRRGYGESGGEWAEEQLGCAQADYVHEGLETAIDIAATVEFLTGQTEVKPSNAVVVGHSAGGWGTIAYGSVLHPKVGAFVVMAGGRGGHRDKRPNNNCRPDLLADAAGHFGKTARTPMLWIYSENDSFFGPPIARALYRAFTSKGGVADFEQLSPYGADGHRLFFGPGGSAIWGPLVERYLAQQHVGP